MTFLESGRTVGYTYTWDTEMSGTVERIKQGDEVLIVSSPKHTTRVVKAVFIQHIKPMKCMYTGDTLDIQVQYREGSGCVWTHYVNKNDFFPIEDEL